MKYLIILSIWLLAFSSHSLEIDQFTDREKYQNTTPDFAPILNEYTNTLLRQAVDKFNRKYKNKHFTDDQIHSHLAFEIYKATAGNPLQPYGFHIPKKLNIFYSIYKSRFGKVQKWITSKVNQPYWVYIKNNVYAGMYPKAFEKNYLVKIGDEFVGPDKIDHFLDQGYSYWIKSNNGQNDQRAKEFGVEAENSWYGLKTGGVFSYGDLRANWGGYQFYKHLFAGPLANFAINPDGQVKMVSSFDWRNHVDWQFDELKNPSLYKAKTEKKIKKRINKNIEKYCHTYYAMKEMGMFDWIWQRESIYLTDEMAMPNSNIFDLWEICP